MAFKLKVMRRVQEIIRKNPDKYNQSNFCGSACCILGHAMIVMGEPIKENAAVAPFSFARRLGIDERFYWDNGPFGMGTLWPAQFQPPTPGNAIKFIDYMIEHHRGM